MRSIDETAELSQSTDGQEFNYLGTLIEDKDDPKFPFLFYTESASNRWPTDFWIFYWCDNDEIHHRYLVSRVKSTSILLFKEEKISVFELAMQHCRDLHVIITAHRWLKQQNNENLRCGIQGSTPD